MFFNENSNGTNIDSEFSSKSVFPLNKKTLTIAGIVLGIFVCILIVLFLPKGEKIKYQKFLVLEGNDDIVIYQNTLYEEPGYKAYDTKHVDLSGEVNVSGEVNTSLVGEYVVTYQLDDIVKERKVSVISRPNQLTYLILSGEPIIHLRVGSTYTEPGYTVIDSVSTDLKDKVVIDGKVDTSKAGTYIIKYSVTNDSGVTVSEKRTIIVTDSSLSLVANPSEYTKDKVTINVSVMDNYFDYVLLPNGNKNSNRSFTYEVNENGTYKFKLFSKDGNSTDSEITVKNIDRTAPKISSCKIQVDKSKASLKVSASDNVGIKSYNYYVDGKSVATNKNGSYTINASNISSSYVIVSDNAGNETKKDCSITYTDPSIGNNNILYYTYSKTEYVIAKTDHDLDTFIKKGSSKIYQSGDKMCYDMCLGIASYYAYVLQKGIDFSTLNYHDACIRWRYGGYYKDYFYETKEEVLGVIYDQINAGKVLYIQVQGSTGRHFVTAIGYKRSVYKKSDMKESDVLYIEVGDGKIHPMDPNLYSRARVLFRKKNEGYRVGLLK